MNQHDQTPQSSSKSAAIVLFLIAGVIILALGMLGGPRQHGGTADVPALRIIEPRDGDTVAAPLTLRFATPAPLRLAQDGWTAGDLHLHVMVDGREIMPAAADIAAHGDAFTWTLPAIEPGPRRLYLTWAGRHHGNLAGHTDTVTVHVRP